jgi:glycine betaine catabolism A
MGGHRRGAKAWRNRPRLYHEFAMGTTTRLTAPGHVYTDPAWFATEMDRVFGAMWIVLARADEIPAAGDFLVREVAGQSLVVVRHQDGSVRAFHNVCRHRGTRLCMGEGGHVAGSLQCPYHAWTYDLAGRLIGAPHMDEVEGFRREDHPLHAVACDTWGGLVFVHLGRDPEPLARQLGDLPARFAPWGLDDLRLARRVSYRVAANWKLIVQNYNECLHCPVIHPMLNRMHHYLGAANVPTTGTYCGGAMGFRDGVETLSTDGRRRRAFLPGLRPEERTLVNYFAIYPNLLLTLHPDYVMTVTIRPRAPMDTELVADFLFHPDEMARPGFVFEDAVEFWDRTNREDWAISEQSQLGIASRAYTPGPYSARETQLWEFDQFVLEKMK